MRPSTTLSARACLRGELQVRGVQTAQGSPTPADSVHRRPRGILTGNDPKRFEKVRTSSENRPDSYLERKQRVSTRARMPKRRAHRRPFELQTLHFRRERGGPKEVNPSTTARVDNYKVLRDCLGGGTYVSQPPRRAKLRSLGRMTGQRHTHIY